MVSTYTIFWQLCGRLSPGTTRRIITLHRGVFAYINPSAPNKSLSCCFATKPLWVNAPLLYPGGTQAKSLPPTQRIGKNYDLVVAHHSPGLPHFWLPCYLQLYTQGRGRDGGGLAHFSSRQKIGASMSGRLVVDNPADQKRDNKLRYTIVRGAPHQPCARRPPHPLAGAVEPRRAWHQARVPSFGSLRTAEFPYCHAGLILSRSEKLVTFRLK